MPNAVSFTSSEVKNTGIVAESFASWYKRSIEERYIHPNAQCDRCGEGIIGVRYHCDKCFNFDFCTNCFHDPYKEHNRTHEYLWIQYRRLTFPCLKGEDITLLQRFDKASSSEQFYMLYPWFFSEDILNLLLNGTENEHEHRLAISEWRKQAGLIGQDAEGTADVQLDQYIRTVQPDDWKWREVIANVRPITELQINRAMFSMGTAHLYRTLSKEYQVETQPACLETAGESFHLEESNRIAEEISNLHSSTPTLAKESSNVYLLRVISNYCKSGSRHCFWKSGSKITYVGEPSGSVRFIASWVTEPGLEATATSMHYQHLTTQVEEFKLLLQDSTEKKHIGSSQRWNISQYVLRQDNIEKLYNTCLDAMKFFVGGNVSYIGLEALSLHSNSVEFSRGTDTVLSRFRDFRQLRNFAEISKLIPVLDMKSAESVLELVLFHEDRGFLQEASSVAASFLSKVSRNGARKDPTVMLIALIKSYVDCFHKALWEDALINATECFTEHISFASVTSSFEDFFITVLLALYSYKILLLTMKDFGKSLDTTTHQQLSTHLTILRQLLHGVGKHCLAFDVLAIEVDFSSTAYGIDLATKFSNTARLERSNATPHRSHVDRIFSQFHTDLESFGSANDIESKLSRANVVVKQASYLVGHLKWVESDRRSGLIQKLHEADGIFQSLSCHLGAAEARLLKDLMSADDNSEEIRLFSTTEDIFRQHGYLRGLLHLDLLKASRKSSLSDEPAPNSSISHSRIFQSLKSIANSMGDELFGRIYDLHSMLNWLEGFSFIASCERVFHPDQGLQSAMVCLKASQILSMLYNSNNNHNEALKYALLFLKYALSAGRASIIEEARMNYLNVIADKARTLKEPYQLVCEFTNLALVWDQFLNMILHEITIRTESRDYSVSYSEFSLLMDKLLWLPRLVRFGIEEDSLQPSCNALLIVLQETLKLAVDLLPVLPPSLQKTYRPRLIEALGTSLEYSGNPIQSLVCYDLAQRIYECIDPTTFDCLFLHLKIGKRLDGLLCLEEQDASFQSFMPLARQFLISAEAIWEAVEHRAAYKSAIEASMTLSRSYLREVQLRTLDVDWKVIPEDEDEAINLEKFKEEVLTLLVKGLKSTEKAISGVHKLRKELSGLPPMQTLENNRFFYFSEMEELYWTHTALNMEMSTATGDPCGLWEAIQKSKATCLVDLLSEGLERNLLTERTPKQSPSFALDDSTNINNFVEDVISNSSLSFENIWEMAETAEKQLGPNESIIFIDWIRYNDTLFLTAVNGTSGRVRKQVIELDYSFIENWVRDNLGINSIQDGRITRKRLEDASVLESLAPILEGLEEFIKDGDLISLSPAGILHAVPIHAIPFRGEGPLILTNPVIYCASHALLYNCYLRLTESTDKPSEASFKAAAFTRVGCGNDEEAIARATAELAIGRFGQEAATITSGPSVTRSEFQRLSNDSCLLHFYGHAYLDTSKRRDRGLIVEPAENHDGVFSVMDIFELKLRKALVVLLACASGEQDIAPNDDPLGLLSAFMYAGAGNVVATLWPTQMSDAREFSRIFYDRAFSTGCVSSNWKLETTGNTEIYLAKAFQEAVVDLYWDWNEESPYHWAQFQLHGAWFYKL